MWLFTKVGFFSAVEAAEPQPELGGPGDVLSIRARVEEDLDALRAAYAPKLGPTIQIPNRDYPYRAYITKEGWAEASARMSLDLDYGNFKSMVAATQGYERAHLYGDVWSVMNDAERKLNNGRGPAHVRADKKRQK